MKVPMHAMKKLEMMHAAGSWGADSAKWSEGRKFISDTLYYTYDNKTRIADGTCPYYLTFEPVKESGQFTSGAAANRPNFTRCRSVEAGTDWRRRSGGGSYSLSVGVSASSLLGVSLGISKTFKDRVYVDHYKIGGNGKLMCGNDDVPAVSHRVMEKRS